MYRSGAATVFLICGSLFFSSACITQRTQDTETIDVSGLWRMIVTTPLGNGRPTMTLRQADGDIAGSYSSSNWGHLDFEGSINGREITFSFEIYDGNRPLGVTYTAVLEGDDLMEGVIRIGAGNRGVFTAARDDDIQQ